MKETISEYYNGEFKKGFFLTGMAIINLALGFIAIRYWADIGAGILVTLGGFGIYQIVCGFWILLTEQNLKERKLAAFDSLKMSFIQTEIQHIASRNQTSEKNKHFVLISFLLGLLCLFVAAFGKRNELMLGIGAGLSLQSALMLIIGLLSNYRNTYYLLSLKRFQRNDTKE